MVCKRFVRGGVVAALLPDTRFLVFDYWESTRYDGTVHRGLHGGWMWPSMRAEESASGGGWVASGEVMIGRWDIANAKKGGVTS